MVSRDKLNQAIILLKRAGVQFSLGGSGLLYACGLVESMNDWDLMTDCSIVEVRAALNGQNYSLKPNSQEFASDYVLQLPDYNTEILGSFRIKTPKGTCRIPNTRFTLWNEKIPLASPEAWFVAYRLMGRDEKADLLRKFIEKNGVDRDIASVLLAEPLPDHLKKEASELFGM